MITEERWCPCGKLVALTRKGRYYRHNKLCRVLADIGQRCPYSGTEA